MSLDIRSKSGLAFHIGYGGFFFMRAECVNQIMPGMGNLYIWSSGSCLLGIEKNKDYEPDLPCPAKTEEFANACGSALGEFLHARKFDALARHLLCHSDCDGKLTSPQCRRLARDLDRITPGPTWGTKFEEFRKIVHEAADRNETLFFG